MTAAETEALPASSASRCWSLPGSLFRGGLAGVLGVLAWELVALLMLGNVHVVIPGQVYRCSQPSKEMVERLVRKYGIRTIVNLRGYCEGADWYDEEHRAAARLGVSVEDLSFSANRLPSTTELQHLIEVLDRSERPILLHCYRGVDRTGLASTLAQLLYTDTPLDDALDQLSLRFLHLSVGRTGHLDRFFDLYEAWLDKHGMTHSPANLRAWLLDGYTAGPCSSRLELMGEPITAAADPQRTAPHIGLSVSPNGLPPPPQPLAGPQRVAAPRGRPFALRVRCHNTSVETWRFNSNLNTGIHCAWQLWHGPDVVGRGRVGAFRADVLPGHFIDLHVPLPSLAANEKYRLQVGLCEENHGHFYEQGSEPLDLNLEAP